MEEFSFSEGVTKVKSLYTLSPSECAGHITQVKPVQHNVITVFCILDGKIFTHVHVGH